MMPVFLIEFRPLRTLLFIFGCSVLMGARHGDPRGVFIAAVVFAPFYWRPLLDAIRSSMEAAREVVLFVEWAWDRLAR